MALFRTPIVVVLGATGAGKSKLSLELAQRFKGEIISADAMQMYHGLNIATNKVTPEEMRAVKHHMIDMLDPLKELVRVNDFRNKCIPILEDLLSKNVIPFVCGGTNYYIESLLWNILVDDDDHSSTPEENAPYQGDDDFSVATERLYEELNQVDPERGATLHKNERRKIYRSLQVFYKHGRKKHSDIIKDQRAAPGGSLIGGPLRYKNVFFLWVDMELSVLDERCDQRVDKMIQRGLIKELEDFNTQFNLKRSSSSDYTMGIFQSIGFKEFHDYLMLEEADKLKPRGQALLQEGIIALKVATHRYARRQLRWIRQRLLNPLNFSHLPVYRMDSTDPSQWRECVFEPSVEIVQAFIEGKSPSMSPVPLLDKPDFPPEDLKKVFECESCQMQFKGIIQFEAHMKSKKHKNRLSKTANSEPRYSLQIAVDSEAFRESDRRAVVNLLKRISKGRLSTSDIFPLFLKESKPMDLRLELKEFGAKRHLNELENLNVFGQIVPLNKPE